MTSKKVVRNRKSRRASLPAQPTGHTAAIRQNRPNQFYHGKGGESIRIHDGTRLVTVGILYPDGVFVKRLKPEHVLRTPPAIAIQADALAVLARRGCRVIRAEISDGRVLVASFEAFQRHALFLNRGYGEQWAFPLSQWQPADAMQQSLFEEVA